LLHRIILEEVKVVGLSERRSWVSSFINGSKGVSKVLLYETNSLTLKVQLMPKSDGRPTAHAFELILLRI